MAARFWRCVLGVELALAVMIALAIGADRHWPASATTLAALIMVAALQLLLVASSFLLARALSPDSPAAGLGRLLRTLMNEYLHFSAAQLRMCAEPSRHLRDIDAPPQGRPARPLLLIHGIACNRAVWHAALAPLHAAGFGPIRALDLEPMFQDINAHTGRVERELLALRERSGRVEVDIVAHSMGGLIARAALHSLGAGVVGNIVTIATPHHGTVMARLSRCPAMLQMRPGSAWLGSLNAPPGKTQTAAITCIYSLEDNLIVPARSAALAGARLHELRGMGHLDLLDSHLVIDHVVAALNVQRRYDTHG